MLTYKSRGRNTQVTVQSERDWKLKVVTIECSQTSFEGSVFDYSGG